MYKIPALIILSILLTGCGVKYIEVSDPELTKKIVHNKKNNSLKILPLRIDAELECYRSGNYERCTNKGRIDKIIKQFNHFGYQPIPGTKFNSSNISVKTKNNTTLFDNLIGLGNFLSLGLIPENSSKTYIATYTSKTTGFETTNSVKIDKSITWFNLLRNSDNNFSDIKNLNSLVETNLLRKTIQESQDSIEKDAK